MCKIVFNMRGVGSRTYMCICGGAYLFDVCYESARDAKKGNRFTILVNFQHQL